MSDLLQRLRERRESRGLAQRVVGEHMGTSQPAVARLENGGADPRLQTVQRYADAVGARIEVVSEGHVDVPGRATTVAAALARGAVDTALRHVIQLLEDFARVDPADLVASLRCEPPTTGDRRFDAMIAAVCERVAHRAGVGVPGWTAAPSRFLDQWWFPVADVLGRLPEGLACYALASSPPEFASRGVFIDPDTLQSA